MASLNRVMIIGRVGRDPRLSYTPSGQAVCNFSVAVDESYKDRNTGQKVEKTEWVNVAAWRQTAEFVGKYIGKGRLVYVEGKLASRKYTAKDGGERTVTEVVADTVQALDKRPDGAQGGGYQHNAAQGGYGRSNADEDLGPAFPSEADDMQVPF